MMSVCENGKARLMFWLLPMVDVVAINKILGYYRSLGVKIPARHARMAMVERWLGYLPVGFIATWLLGWCSVFVFFIAYAISLPVESYLMVKGVNPWGFLKGVSKKTIIKIFMLESYNIAGYFLLGVLFASLLMFFGFN